MSDTTNTEMIRLSDALAAANASVAELERERDQLALSLSATKAERDHAIRSAELLEDELHNSESARRDFEHAWLEGRAIMAVSMYFGRMRGPDAWLDHGSWDEYPELFACTGVDLRSFQHGTRFYAGSAPVPAAQMDNPDVMARATAYARDIVTWLHRDHYADSTAFEPFDDLLGLLSQIDNMICGWKEHPAAQAEAKVADDVRLGNRLYVWDYKNPEDGSWDNIEEYLHDTTPGVGDVVRLNLAMPLQDVEVEMLEVGRSGEPIRWQVRDVKTGAMLAAKAKGGGA